MCFGWIKQQVCTGGMSIDEAALEMSGYDGWRCRAYGRGCFFVHFVNYCGLMQKMGLTLLGKADNIHFRHSGYYWNVE